MALQYSFVDNKTYGVDDINQIVQDLVGAGVAPFTSKTSYNVSDLNALTSSIISSGTELDGCKCSISGNTVTIAKGIIYFNSGVRLTVDNAGYTINVTANTSGYIYAIYKTAEQMADIVFNTSLPVLGDFVELAKVNSNGTLNDTRKFARSKIATLGNNVSKTVTAVKYTETSVVDDRLIYGYFPNINTSAYNYAFADELKNDGSNNRDVVLFDLNSNKFIGNRSQRYDLDTDTLTYIYVKNNTLVVATHNSDSSYWAYNGCSILPTFTFC